MRLRIAKIHEQAADRPPGYVEDVISRGLVDGDWLEISSEALAELREKYRPAPPAPMRGLGDLVERAAKPIAVALRLPCLDENKSLRPESPCAKRRDALNKMVPFAR